MPIGTPPDSAGRVENRGKRSAKRAAASGRGGQQRAVGTVRQQEVGAVKAARGCGGLAEESSVAKRRHVAAGCQREVRQRRATGVAARETRPAAQDATAHAVPTESPATRTVTSGAAARGQASPGPWASRSRPKGFSRDPLVGAQRLRGGCENPRSEREVPRSGTAAPGGSPPRSRAALGPPPASDARRRSLRARTRSDRCPVSPARAPGPRRCPPDPRVRPPPATSPPRSPPWPAPRATSARGWCSPGA